MAMGRKQAQPCLLDTAPKTQGHPFYQTLEQILSQHDFDGFVEQCCRKFYSRRLGRHSTPPGLYFRALLMGYFEGLGSERAIAWRLQDSLSLRAWLGFGPTDPVPSHVTLSNTRNRISVKAHREVFRFVLARVGEAGLLCGQTLGIDASSIEANAALRSIVRKGNGQSYKQFLDALLKAAGIPHPTAEQRRQMDKKRKKKMSNKEWENPHEPEAKIIKLKDGRTHFGYKDEQTVDLDTGAVLSVVVQPGDRGDPQSMPHSVKEAQDNLRSIREGPAAQDKSSHVRELVGDKGYHSNGTLLECEREKLRSYLSEPERGRRRWKGNPTAHRAVYGNRQRIRGSRGKQLLRRRGELLERPFCHRLDIGGMRRAHVRGQSNIQKREYLAASAQNLGLLMRQLHGVGTPRSLQSRRPALPGAQPELPWQRYSANHALSRASPWYR
jgi:transposase